MGKKNLYLDEIIEIKEVGNFQTYDFTIPHTHCFFANDILVHNSGSLEQMADKVIFIYKEIAEDKTTRQEYVKHYLNLAKNRQGRTGQQQIFFEGEYYRLKDVGVCDTFNKAKDIFNAEEING